MEITAAYLLIALAAYAVFGGADFGGGILEATLPRHPHLQRKIEETLAPVWEANHVWLIAVIVILFVGFPAAYAALCTALFVPISLALLGIILRGAFFTFRKYDPDPAPRRALYSALFRASSALTPMMYGFIIAALLTPLPVPGRAGAFPDLYIRPWLTPLGALCAAFVFALFGYVAAVFLHGELDNDADRATVRRRIVAFFAGTFLLGGAVLACGLGSGTVHLPAALTPVQLAAQAGALAAILVGWRCLRTGRDWGLRLAAGAQVVCILAGWFATQYPALLRFGDGRVLTFHNAAAPPVTLLWLNIGLTAVLALVLPLLIYLYRVFSRARREEPGS